MFLDQYTIFKIVRIDNVKIVVDSTTTQQWLTEEKALEEARKIRDRLNENAGHQMYTLIRGKRSRLVKPL